MAEHGVDNAALAAASANLPPGWDCRYDGRTGRFYYINYFTKTTTWEDPRHRYRPVAQPPPQFFSSGMSGEVIPLQDLTNIRPSPIPNRAYTSAVGTASQQSLPYSMSPSRPPATPSTASTIQETSLNIETEQAVTKIGAMFPTVGETHIRTLLKKYMKSVFPAVEETLLLDILSNAENNVQKATERLMLMGFEKRDTPPPRLTQRRKEEEQRALEKQKIAAATPTPPPRMKSLEEKQKMKTRLQEQYPDIPERVVTIALDSSDFDEERAAHILQVMVQEESSSKPSSAEASTSSSKEGMNQELKSQSQAAGESGLPLGSSPSHLKGSPARKQGEKKEKTPQHRRSKGKKEIPKVSRGTSTTEDMEYKSPNIQRVNGPNAELHLGPNDELLLADYVTWNGPNRELRNGPRKSLAKGPDPSLREGRTCLAKGPNKDLYHGPVQGLAKGSVYAQLALCNTESRGN